MIQPKMTPVAQLGDLVHISGYANQLFRVDSYTHEFTFERGIETEDIYYDCSCVTAGEYTLAAQEDITVLCGEAQAAEFMKTYKHPEIDVKASEIYEGLFANMTWGAEDMEKTNAKAVEPKEMTKQERIDAYLDELINVENAKELIGDGGEVAYYAAKKSGIEAGLRALEEGR